MTRPSTKLRANGNYIDNIDHFPFVLRLSKHERIFSHTLRSSMARRIWVAVKPQARKEEVVRLAAGEYRVSVHAPAKDGKANEAVIELLANYFSVTKSAIRMVRGQSARRKLIEIS